MKYRLKSDPSVTYDAHSDFINAPGQVGDLVRIAWEPVPNAPLPTQATPFPTNVTPFHHFEVSVLFQALSVCVGPDGSLWSSDKNGWRHQRLASCVVEYVAGKMLDPAIREMVLAARRTSDGEMLPDENVTPPLSQSSPDKMFLATDCLFRGCRVWIEGNKLAARAFVDLWNQVIAERNGNISR